jgi:ribosomal protein L29
MSDVAETERKLFEALARLAKGNSSVSNGKITQENVAMEAGVSRATFNRYPTVVAEYRRTKARGDTTEEDQPLSAEDKNRELKESNVALRRDLSQEKLASETLFASARQEIFVLTTALQLRGKTIAERDRQIAELKRQIVQLRQHPTDRLAVVRRGD